MSHSGAYGKANVGISNDKGGEKRKGTDFSKVSAAEIAATEEWINNYPRKILGYKSSEVMFRECLREIGLIA